MEDHQSIHKIGITISIVWREKKFDVHMSPSATLKELGDRMQKLTNVRADTIGFIVPQSLTNKSSKLLNPFSNEHERLSLQETTIIEGKPIRMMGVFENEVNEIIQGEKQNSTIAGFDEEENRLRKRISNGPQFSRKLPQGPYTFGDFRTLQLPGIQLTPPASEALKRMHMLASDPGIVAIMNKHRWRVGIMTEMAPEGYVGISSECILGYNKNQGEEISLRLRTDDLKGFRKYEMIKKTLLHELAHMVYSEHDADFHALNKQLNEEAHILDWTKSKGHTLSGIRHSEFDDEEVYVKESNATSQKLGGNTSEQLASARMASVTAAYRRMANAPPSTSSEASKVSEDEPDPDDSKFCALDDPAQNDHLVKAKLDDDSFDDVGQKHYEEPDPDYVSDSRNESEPDPDDVQEEKAINEPDPDELVAKQDALGCGVVPRPVEEDSLTSGKVDDRSHLGTGYERSDLGGSREDGAIQAMQIDEPDPDDEELQRIRDPVTIACGRLQKAIELLRAEVGPGQAIAVLQTLIKIISNVIEHPNETKFKKLRKANPVIQRTIANYKAAIELLVLIGFIEDRVSDEMGKVETYLVLKRNDPGFLWLAKSCIETTIAP